jgi:hypothetical protein
MVAPWICSTIPLSPRCLRKLRGAGFEPKSQGGCFAGQSGFGWVSGRCTSGVCLQGDNRLTTWSDVAYLFPIDLVRW